MKSIFNDCYCVNTFIMDDKNWWMSFHRLHTVEWPSTLLYYCLSLMSLICGCLSSIIELSTCPFVRACAHRHLFFGYVWVTVHTDNEHFYFSHTRHIWILLCIFQLKAPSPTGTWKQQMINEPYSSACTAFCGIIIFLSRFSASRLIIF